MSGLDRVGTVSTTRIAAVPTASEELGGEHRQPADRVGVGRGTAVQGLVVPYRDRLPDIDLPREPTRQRASPPSGTEGIGAIHPSECRRIATWMPIM
jgi:hypothetical protein